MNTLRTIIVAGLFAFGMSGGVLAAGLTDMYDPYVTADEIEVAPTMISETEQRLNDIYDPFILSSEITTTESCVNPAVALVTDQYDPFVTVAELETAQMRNTC